jgi:hypothetical protein
MLQFLLKEKQTIPDTLKHAVSTSCRFSEADAGEREHGERIKTVKPGAGGSRLQS